MLVWIDGVDNMKTLPVTSIDIELRNAHDRVVFRYGHHGSCFVVIKVIVAIIWKLVLFSYTENSEVNFCERLRKKSNCTGCLGHGF